MRYSLRDLLWLTILVAVGTTWWLDYRPMDQEWRRLLALRARPTIARETDANTQARLEEVAKLAKFTDAQLAARFKALFANGATESLEPCLAEMAKRHMAKELASHLMEHRERNREKTTPWPVLDDLELLTALRRAEDLPDPLTIHVVPVKDEEKRRWSPQLSANMENVDAKQETFILVRLGDYRGGRPERWRFILRDEAGAQVADVDFHSIMAGGISQSGPFKYGETYGTYSFDLRAYLKMPQPGKYTLQVYYHNRREIASEADLAGLVVSHSPPLPVLIHTPSLTPQQRFALWVPIMVCSLATIVLLVGIYRRWLARLDESRPRFWRRDIAFCLLFVAIGAGWSAWQTYGNASIKSLRAERDPQWEIELLNM